MSNTGIYRGGQPSCPADWAYLRKLGVTSVVKLNSEDEGQPGIPVYAFPISIEQQMLGTDLEGVLNLAVLSIKPNTYVHCEHGQDRTGLVVAIWRTKQGWSKADAEKEMLSHGFHPALVGLWEYWKKYNV